MFLTPTQSLDLNLSAPVTVDIHSSNFEKDTMIWLDYLSYSVLTTQLNLSTCKMKIKKTLLTLC